MKKEIVLLLMVAFGLTGHAANRNSDIAVPAEPIEFDLYAGLEPRTNGALIVISNSGVGLVRWGAATDSGLLTITPTAGSILPHRAFPIDLQGSGTSSLPAGLYEGHILITNLSGLNPVDRVRVL